MVVDVVGFVLLVFVQDILAGHSWDDGEVCWWGLGYWGVASVQEKLAIVDDPGPYDIFKIEHA